MQPLTPDHGPVTGGTAITITGAELRARRDGHRRRRARDRRPGVRQHADRRGDAGWRGRAGRRRRHRRRTARRRRRRSSTIRCRAGPDLQPDQQRPGRRRRGGRLGAAVRLQPGRPDRRRARSGQRPADQRPGVRRADAPARPLHALPGRGRDRRVLRHARRRRQSRRDAGPPAVPLPDRDRRGDPRVPGRAGASRGAPSTRACSPGWRRPTSRPSSSRTCRSWSIGRCAGIRSRGAARTPSRARRRPRSCGTSRRARRTGTSTCSTCCRTRARRRRRRCRSATCCRRARRSCRPSTSCRTRARPSTSTSSPG